MVNQYTKFSIILYEYPTTDLLLLLGVKDYAFIEHCFDYNEDGTLKNIHYHLYINLYKKKTCSGVYSILNIWKENCSQPFLIQKIDNVPAFIRYLIHIDNPNKYQYNITDIVSNFDLTPYFSINITDSEFTLNVIKLIDNRDIKNFKELVNYSILNAKLDLIMKRSYFFKCLF